MEKIDKRKIKYIAGFGGIVVLLIFAMGYFIFGVGKAPAEQSSGQSASVQQSVPSGESQKIMESKSEAYQTGGVQRKRSALDGYFETLAPEGEDISLVSDDESSAGSSGTSGAAGAQGSGASTSGQASGSDAVTRYLGGPSSDDASSSGNSSGGSGYRGSGSGNRSGSGGTSGSGSSGARSISSMTPEEKLEYDRRRAEMVRDVLTDQNGAGSAANSPVAGSDADGRPAAGHTAEAEPLDFSFSSSDGIISSLDDEIADRFRGGARDDVVRNDGVIRYADDVKRPFRCMFIRDEKIKNGQRVAVRLLEEYKQDGIRIPANTHLQAICKIDDRLRLTIRSLEMNGKIIPLQLEAYDSDGLAGIYCPEASKSVKTATNDLITTAGSSLGGLVGNLANTVIRTGATIARTASGENTVTINSGYEFYLVKIEKR